MSADLERVQAPTSAACAVQVGLQLESGELQSVHQREQMRCNMGADIQSLARGRTQRQQSARWKGTRGPRQRLKQRRRVWEEGRQRELQKCAPGACCLVMNASLVSGARAGLSYGTAGMIDHCWCAEERRDGNGVYQSSVAICANSTEERLAGAGAEAAGRVAATGADEAADAADTSDVAVGVEA